MEASGLRRRHAVRDEDDGGDENAPLLGGDHQVHARSPSPSPPSPAAAAPAPHTSQVVAYGTSAGIFDMIVNMLSNFFSSIFTSSAPIATVAKPDIDIILDEETRKTMDEFKRYLEIKFDIKNPQHFDSLKQLWKIAFHDQVFPEGINSKLWKDLGFQSDDPQRDFRATGYFGLRNVIFFAEKYPASFLKFANLRNERTFETYPFAVTCFNLTMLVMELLGWGWRSKTSTAKLSRTYSRCISIIFAKDHAKEANENAFSEVFSMALGCLDKVWVDSKATYMDFPNVLTKTQLAVENAISECNCLADVLASNSQELR